MWALAMITYLAVCGHVHGDEGVYPLSAEYMGLGAEGVAILALRDPSAALPPTACVSIPPDTRPPPGWHVMPVTNELVYSINTSVHAGVKTDACRALHPSNPHATPVVLPTGCSGIYCAYSPDTPLQIYDDQCWDADVLLAAGSLDGDCAAGCTVGSEIPVAATHSPPASYPFRSESVHSDPWVFSVDLSGAIPPGLNLSAGGADENTTLSLRISLEVTLDNVTSPHTDGLGISTLVLGSHAGTSVGYCEPPTIFVLWDKDYRRHYDIESIVRGGELETGGSNLLHFYGTHGFFRGDTVRVERVIISSKCPDADGRLPLNLCPPACVRTHTVAPNRSTDYEFHADGSRVSVGTYLWDESVFGNFTANYTAIGLSFHPKHAAGFTRLYSVSMFAGNTTHPLLLGPLDLPAQVVSLALDTAAAQFVLPSTPPLNLTLAVRYASFASDSASTSLSDTPSDPSNVFDSLLVSLVAKASTDTECSLFGTVVSAPTTPRQCDSGIPLGGIDTSASALQHSTVSLWEGVKPTNITDIGTPPRNLQFHLQLSTRLGAFPNTTQLPPQYLWPVLSTDLRVHPDGTQPFAYRLYSESGVGVTVENVSHPSSMEGITPLISPVATAEDMLWTERLVLAYQLGYDWLDVVTSITPGDPGAIPLHGLTAETNHIRRVPSTTSSSVFVIVCNHTDAPARPNVSAACPISDKYLSEGIADFEFTYTPPSTLPFSDHLNADKREYDVYVMATNFDALFSSPKGLGALESITSLEGDNGAFDASLVFADESLFPLSAVDGATPVGYRMTLNAGETRIFNFNYVDIGTTTRPRQGSTPSRTVWIRPCSSAANSTCPCRAPATLDILLGETDPVRLANPIEKMSLTRMDVNVGAFIETGVVDGKILTPTTFGDGVTPPHFLLGTPHALMILLDATIYTVKVSVLETQLSKSAFSAMTITEVNSPRVASPLSGVEYTDMSAPIINTSAGPTIDRLYQGAGIYLDTGVFPDRHRLPRFWVHEKLDDQSDLTCTNATGLLVDPTRCSSASTWSEDVEPFRLCHDDCRVQWTDLVINFVDSPGVNAGYMVTRDSKDVSLRIRDLHVRCWSWNLPVPATLLDIAAEWKVDALLLMAVNRVRSLQTSHALGSDDLDIKTTVLPVGTNLYIPFRVSEI